MKSNFKLSIIVPVFNVAPFVEKCIRSLYDQDLPLSEYEVIVIDDCSTDNSREIILNLQNEYKFLRLITLKRNSKQGAARNIGLNLATGEFIWFIDSDDYIQTNILKYLINKLIKYDLEVLHFDYQFLNKEGAIVPYDLNYNLETCTGAEFYFDSNELWWKKGVEVWRYICKKSFILTYNLRFEENVIFEDTDYSIKLFALAKKVKHINCAPVFYRYNNSSSTNSEISPIVLKYWLLLTLRCDKLKQELVNNKEVDTRFISILDLFIKYHLSTVYTKLKEFSFKNKKDFRKIISNLKLKSLKKYISIFKFLYIKYPII